jgi:two-component system invasion response regulator UvrY
MTSVALVDDHRLLRNGLAQLINSLTGYRVLLEADNGKHLIEQLDPRDPPQVVLLDLEMPEMNGYETAVWLRNHYPQTKVIALTMVNDERAVIKMLRNGAKGYLLKDTEIPELKKAMDAVVDKGIYINELLYNNIVLSMNGQYVPEETEQQQAIDLTEREKEFLRWLCTDKSYKEIAASMYLSPRTIDGYRDILFEKIKAASRIGLVMFAIRTGIVKV